MEDELFEQLYRIVLEEDSHRPRRKGVVYTDGMILLVALWAALHDRPMSWACQLRHWSARFSDQWFKLPSAATMSKRLRELSLQLLLEQVIYRLVWSGAWRLLIQVHYGFCLARRIDSKPLPVGGFSKDRDARRGYATGGKARGYKLFWCTGISRTAPEMMVIGPMNLSDQVGAIELIDRLEPLHGSLGGYLLADSTHDTNPLAKHADDHGMQLISPRKEPYTQLGHRTHHPARLRGIELLEADADPLGYATNPSRSFGSDLYRQREPIERELANWCSFGGGLAPLPAWVRRPHRVVLWVNLKLIINALRIARNHGLAA